MTRTDVPRITLTPEQCRRWKAQIKEFDYLHGDNDLYSLSPKEAMAAVETASGPVNDDFLLAAIIAQATTPETLKDDLAGFGTADAPDVILLEVDPEIIDVDVSLIPKDGYRNLLKPVGVDDIVLTGIIKAAGGDPVALMPESGFDPVMPVSPTPGKEKSKSSKGGGPLGWHIDNMPFARPYRPDYFGLMGLISTERVTTTFALIDDILAALHKLNPRHEQVLRQPLFQCLTPISFHFDGSQQVRSDPFPIIENDPDGRPLINFNDYSLIRDHDDPSILAALHALAKVLGDPKVVRGEWISPGKVLLISNARALHGRGEVQGKRYLTRLYGKRDLTALRSLPSGGDHVCRFRFMMTPDEMVAACRWPRLAAV
jgi:hypothetical protein